MPGQEICGLSAWEEVSNSPARVIPIATTFISMGGSCVWVAIFPCLSNGTRGAGCRHFMGNKAEHGFVCFSSTCFSSVLCLFLAVVKAALESPSPGSSSSPSSHSHAAGEVRATLVPFKLRPPKTALQLSLPFFFQDAIIRVPQHGTRIAKALFLLWDDP